MYSTASQRDLDGPVMKKKVLSFVSNLCLLLMTVAVDCENGMYGCNSGSARMGPQLSSKGRGISSIPTQNHSCHRRRQNRHSPCFFNVLIQKDKQSSMQCLEYAGMSCFVVELGTVPRNDDDGCGQVLSRPTQRPASIHWP